ncbi:MAG TPA: FAD-dependent oxidoreductase, partial [Acidimicrobiales bacterium]
MTLAQREALVVGGGVIGLTTAFFLASEGWRVTIFDPAPGSGATWAAAGMIAPFAEVAPGEEENFRHQRGSVSAWRDVAARIAELTGDVLTLMETGTLVV